MVSPTTRTQRTWHQYHNVRTTTKKWVDFVSLSTSEPVFYQYVTDGVFKELIQARFPMVSHQRSVTITNEEANVIRYAAGYTLRTLRKQIEKGSHPLKEEMVLTTIELVADDEDDEEEQETSAEWVNLVGRGGLWHITNECSCSFVPLKRSFAPTSKFRPSRNSRMVRRVTS